MSYHVPRRKTALPTDVWFTKRVTVPTCLEQFSLLLVEVGPLEWVRIHQKEMILTCQSEMAVRRVVCLFCVCWLANHGFSLKSWQQINFASVVFYPEILFIYLWFRHRLGSNTKLNLYSVLDLFHEKRSLNMHVSFSCVSMRAHTHTPPPPTHTHTHLDTRNINQTLFLREILTIVVFLKQIYTFQ